MQRSTALPYLLVAPSVVFLGVLFLLPLFETAALAFREGGAWSFGNFSRAADDINFPDAVRNTFSVVLLAVPLQLALALGMTMMLRHVKRGRDLISDITRARTPMPKSSQEYIDKCQAYAARCARAENRASQ